MDLMRLRPTALVAACLTGGILLVGACTTDYQLGQGDPNFGGPNALAGKRPPGATNETSNEAGAGSTSGASSTPACVAAGGTLAGSSAPDGGTCAVSFSKEILAAFGLANCATAACHLGSTPRNPPQIEPSDGPGTWKILQGFTGSAGLPYINPCSTDDTKAAMGANMLPDPGPAKGGVHMPQGAQLPQGDIDKINIWLKCGSPNN
jgi:hypothetical protein